MNLLLVLCSALIVAAPTQQSAQGGQSPRPGGHEWISNTISGFNIVLVVGETQPSGTSAAEELPAGARKALADMREFLPYKHYRVLDAQWSSCCSPKATTMVTGRLQGVIATPGANNTVNLLARPYGFSVTASGSSSNLPVRFILSLEDASSRRTSNRESERERQDMSAEVENLQIQIKEAQRRVEVGVTPETELRQLQQRHASLQRRLVDLTNDAQAHAVGGRPIIDSSFTMDAGETVVVGTSKLGGDKALIAIVTAVRKGKARE